MTFDYGLTSGPNSVKLFTAVIYKCSEQVREFFPGRASKSNLMFVSKARSLPEVLEHLKGALLRLTLALLANIRLGNKCLQGIDTLAYYKHL